MQIVAKCMTRLRQGSGGQFSFRFGKKTGGGGAILTRTSAALILVGYDGGHADRHAGKDRQAAGAARWRASFAVFWHRCP